METSEETGHTSKCNIVDMHGGLDHLDLTTHIIFFYMFAKINHRRVSWVVCTKYFDSFIDLIRFIEVIDYHNVNARGRFNEILTNQ